MFERRILCKWPVITGVIVLTAALSLTEASFAKAKIASMANGSSKHDPWFWRRSGNKTLLSPVIFGEYFECRDQ